MERREGGYEKTGKWVEKNSFPKCRKIELEIVENEQKQVATTGCIRNLFGACRVTELYTKKGCQGMKKRYCAN